MKHTDMERFAAIFIKNHPEYKATIMVMIGPETTDAIIFPKIENNNEGVRLLIAAHITELIHLINNKI